jgi:hypothetical protein
MTSRNICLLASRDSPFEFTEFVGCFFSRIGLSIYSILAVSQNPLKSSQVWTNKLQNFPNFFALKIKGQMILNYDILIWVSKLNRFPGFTRKPKSANNNN